MHADSIHWYRSKVDWWLGLLLIVPPLASVSVSIALLQNGGPSDGLWALAIVGIVLGMYFGLIIPMRYGMDDSHLIVRFGACRQRILMADISEVRPTHNPLSSPALSLDRLSIQFGPSIFKSVMISPVDRDRFLDELAAKAQLMRVGDKLLRG
jgi:hypothetical protein